MGFFRLFRRADLPQNDIEEGGGQDLAGAYTSLTVDTGDLMDVEEVKLLLKKITCLDGEVVAYNLQYLEAISRVAREKNESFDINIAWAQKKVIELEGAIRGGTVRQAIEQDEDSLNTVRRVIRELLRGKAQILVMLRTVLEVHEMVEMSREIMRNKVVEVGRKLEELEASSKRAREIDDIIVAIKINARVDSLDFQKLIRRRVHPALLELVREAVDHHAELIIKGSAFLAQAAGTSDGTEDLGEAAEALQIPGIIEDKMSDPPGGDFTTILYQDDLGPDVVDKFQRDLEADFDSLFKGDRETTGLF